VTSNLPANSGTANEMLLSPKANLIYSLGQDTELYASAGRGFHSNDARGTTITVDPTTGAPADKVSPLVPSHEIELGFRSFVDRKINISAAVWMLDLDSELLFSGDAGDTEANRASHRYGVEVPIYYRPTDRITFDFEVAFTHSRYSHDDPVGNYIPGSITQVYAAGVTLQSPRGFFGALRYRYFGPRPLVEDANVMSSSSAVVNLEAGYKSRHFDFRVDVLNLFDSKDDDIAYWYASRLRGEPAAGVDDYHFHPIEPRDLRAYFTWKF
jgi:outer membrane receptor protein involved in Fe transport